jgi:UDP-N-acetylglucosamine transferase subunit ALG13
MILVTVGTHGQGFDRLVIPMDEIAGLLDEQVIIQRGFSSYVPRQAEQFRFTSGGNMASLTRSARIVVSHAAAGAIILGLQHCRPMVVVPRLRRFGEHTDDHQLQLAAALAGAKLAIAVYEPSINALKEAMSMASALQISATNRSPLVPALNHLLQEFGARKSRSRWAPMRK